MTEPKIALAMIVRGTDAEADCLKNCLSFVAPYVDGIFITRTNKPGEEHNEKVQRVAELYNAHLSDFEWVNSFAKARNFNFSQVSKDYDYILWLDADDGLRGAEKLKETIKENPADTYILHYMYGFDENKNPITVHAKTQVIRNDDCVEWVGDLHEDFNPKREITSFFIKGIERVHLTTDERLEAAKERNLNIALEQLEKNPEDPRSYWNVANSQAALQKYDWALQNFSRFLELSLSDDEKYMARLRRSEIFWTQGKIGLAIDEARFALGTRPLYPDAYLHLGGLFYRSERYWEAADMYLQGLLKKPPYYEIIAYNPREYDFIPMVNLAKTYIALHRPDLALPLLEGAYKIVPTDEGLEKIITIIRKEATQTEAVLKEVARLLKIKSKEKLKEELDKISDDYKDHPAVCKIRNTNFIKTKSSGKDIVFFCGITEDVWNPKTAREQGVGGSEEAIIHLAEGLAKNGWKVTVYNNCGFKEEVFSGVTYKPHWSWNYRDKQDVVVLWRHPKPADFDINADTIVVDLHDVIQEGEFNEKRMSKITKIFVKSDFHRSLFPNIPDDKFVIIPNGIDPTAFFESEKDNKLVINTSSPDRSISAFIEVAKLVKKKIPDAKFQWAYGWKIFDAVHGSNPKIMEWKSAMKKGIAEAGIDELGRVSHEKVAQLYRKANVFLYPTEFAEIHCISAAKAQAGGAIPVCTDFAALNETVQFGFKEHSHKTKDDWAGPYQFDYGAKDEKAIKAMAEEVVRLIENPPTNRERMMEWAKETYSWDNVINQWHSHLTQF